MVDVHPGTPTSAQRIGVAALALVLAAVGVTLAFLTFRPPASIYSPGPAARPSPAASPSESPAPSSSPFVPPSTHTAPIPGAFYPTLSREGDRTVMPVTLVDGTTAELVFADGLEPRQLGIYGEIVGGLGRIDRAIYYRYGDDSAFKGSGPLATFEGRDGAVVEEWEPPPGSFRCPTLVFRFGDWFVGVRTCQDQLTPEEKTEWARRLLGRQTDDGFLVLSALAPLTIAAAGEHEGPQLWVVGPERGWPFIILTPGACDPDQPASNEELRVTADGQVVSFSRIGRIWYADWCEDGRMKVQVESPDRGYVEAAAEGLRVRRIQISR